jgi:general secretion pathway protein I
MKNKTKVTKGFTLIECLVALLIIALVLSAAARAIGLAITNVKDSYSREVANWIADNTYNQFYIDGVYPDLGSSTKPVTMAGIDYIETVNIVSTPNQYFRKIEISVAEKSHPDYALYRTVNFIAQY